MRAAVALANVPPVSLDDEEALEAAYWRFDSAKASQSVRDAFKDTARGLLRARRPVLLEPCEDQPTDHPKELPSLYFVTVFDKRDAPALATTICEQPEDFDRVCQEAHKVGARLLRFRRYVRTSDVRNASLPWHDEEFRPITPAGVERGLEVLRNQDEAKASADVDAANAVGFARMVGEELEEEHAVCKLCGVEYGDVAGRCVSAKNGMHLFDDHASPAAIQVSER